VSRVVSERSLYFAKSIIIGVGKNQLMKVGSTRFNIIYIEVDNGAQGAKEGKGGGRLLQRIQSITRCRGKERRRGELQKIIRVYEDLWRKKSCMRLS
jgi:hypothetical protein